MATFPPDVLRYIAMVKDMTVRDILTWCRSEKRIQQAVCSNVDFWKALLADRLGVTMDRAEGESDQTYIQIHQNIIDKYDKLRHIYNRKIFNELYELIGDIAILTPFEEESDRETMLYDIGYQWLDIQNNGMSLNPGDFTLIIKGALSTDHKQYFDEEDWPHIREYIARYFPYMTGEELTKLVIETIDTLPILLPPEEFIAEVIQTGNLPIERLREIFHAAITHTQNAGYMEDGVNASYISAIAPLLDQETRRNSLVWLFSQNINEYDDSIVSLLRMYATPHTIAAAREILEQRDDIAPERKEDLLRILEEPEGIDIQDYDDEWVQV